MNQTPDTRLTFTCIACGSDAISRDAWAEWDAAGQTWVIGAMFDYAHCHHCGADIPLRPVVQAPPSADMLPDRTSDTGC